MTRTLMIDGIGFTLDGQPFDMWGIRLANALESDAIALAVIRQLDEYVAHGINTFAVFLQGGSTGSANPFDADGNFSKNTRREECSETFKGRGDAEPIAKRNQVLDRLAVLIEQADARGMAVNVGIFYQARIRQLTDESAILRATENTARWLVAKDYTNVFMDLVNEYGHWRFEGIPTCYGRAERYASDGGEQLIGAFKQIAPGIPASISADSTEPVLFDNSDLVLIHAPYSAAETRTRAGRNVPVVLNEWGYRQAGGPVNTLAGTYTPACIAKWKQTIQTMRQDGGFVFLHSMWKQHLTDSGDPHFELGPADTQPNEEFGGIPSERWYFEMVKELRGL